MNASVGRARSGVPVIGLSGFRSDDTAARWRVSHAIGIAFRERGFILIGGGIVPDPIGSMHSTAAKFFPAPDEEKKLEHQFRRR